MNSDVASRVASAIAVVGPPPSARSRAELAAAEERSGSEASELISRVDQMAAELEARLPQDVSSIVYEALRVEVQPVSRHVAELDALSKLISARLGDMRLAIARERNERLEDVALLAEGTTRSGAVQSLPARLSEEASRAFRRRIAFV